MRHSRQHSQESVALHIIMNEIYDANQISNHLFQTGLVIVPNVILPTQDQIKIIANSNRKKVNLFCVLRDVKQKLWRQMYEVATRN
jgi:hypothetical protein